MNGAHLARQFAQAFRQTDLILYAGTNLLGRADPSADVEELGMMPVIGAGAEKQQPNVAALAELERASCDLVCQIFRGDFAEVRFQSCTQANLAVFAALLLPGDRVICLHRDDGGHPSQNADGMLAHFAVELIAAPFDGARQCIDDAATAALVERVRPKLVVIGPSTVLRASCLSATARAAHACGAVLLVDISHVAGLVAGDAFPNPLDGGADLLSGSSYKTLGCPPAGFVVGRGRSLEEKLRGAASPKLLSNYDAGRLLRFSVALARSRAEFGAYARAILANTRALHAALVAAQVALQVTTDGCIDTHQILLSAADRGSAVRIVAQLQESGVTTSLAAVPGVKGSWGIRLGTQLVTRRGMGEAEMGRIAQIIAAVIRSSGARNLRADVQALTGAFKEVLFCGATAPGHA